MLDTVRAYGAEWLEATGDAARLRRRHRDWYLGLATWCELDWFSPRQAEVATRVEVELPNLRSALEHCLAEPDEAHLGQYLAGSLWFYWAGCGRLSEGRRWLDQVVRLDSGHEQSRLRALWVLAYVAILQGDTVPALAALQECREEAERSGDPTAVAYAEHRTGCLALVTDDMPRAETLLRSALDRYQEIGELNSNVLMGQVELAMARAFQGDLPDAVRLCEDARRVCEDHGERWTRTYALYVLAYAAWAYGDPAGARALLVDCLAERALLPRPARLGAGGGAAGPGHGGAGRCGGGCGAAGRGDADVAVGGSAAVRLGVLQRPARAVRGDRAGAAGRPAVRGLRGGGGAAGAGGGGVEGAGAAAGRRPVAAGPVRYATASVNMHEPAASRARKGGETAG